MTAQVSVMAPQISHQKNCLFLAMGCIAFIVSAYWHDGSDLMAAWQTEEYSHGMVIPLIAVLLAWHRLTEVRPAIQPSWWGLLFLGISGILFLVAALAAFQTAAHYGFILALSGISIAFLGTKATKVITPALIYLFFAVPLPHLVYTTLSQDLQLFSSTMGVWFLDLVGISVYQEGNIIDLGGYKLQVVEACSGLRYLFPLISFSYLMAYLLEDKAWKRLIVFLSAIPITVFMNSLRIGIIGVTVNWWGIEMAEGFIHEFEGWVVFMICVLILLGEVMLLLKVGTGGRFHYEVFGPAHGSLFSSQLELTTPVIAATSMSAVLCVVFGMGIVNQREQVIPQHPPFSTFPKTLESWNGKQLTLEPDVLVGLQLSDYVLADYTSESEKSPVNFYIAYYDTQRVGSATHSPSSCIPGGGWQIADRSVQTIALPDNKSVTVSRFLIKQANVTQLVYFWFDERGRDITETSYAKWYMLVDSITMHRTDGALVRLVTPVANGENEADAEKRLQQFLSLAYPSIKTFIPGSSLPPT